MNINYYTSGVQATPRNLKWYLSLVKGTLPRTITFDTSKALYLSDNLTSIIRRTRAKDYVITNEESEILVSEDEGLIAKFKEGSSLDLESIHVSEVSVDLSDTYLIGKILDPTYSKEEITNLEIEPAVEFYSLISQATGLDTDQVKNVLVSAFGVSSILLMEMINEDCEDPMLEVEGLGYVSIEDNKPLILKGEYGVDKFTNLRLSADQMLYGLITMKNKDRLSKVKGDKL